MFKIMQESFLCQWLKKLSMSDNNHTWTWVPNVVLRVFGRKCACFSATNGPANFKGLSTVTSVFWKNVIKTWLKYNKISNNHSSKMACLWNNTEITYQNSVLYFRKWAEGGFTFVYDLLQDNILLSFENIEAILGPSPSLYMEYMVVYSAVSVYLRYHTTYALDPVKGFELLLNGNTIITAKAFRKYIVETKYSTPCAVQFWRHKFNIEVHKQHWNIYKGTQETRLRELHWKILHNIYPTNILLQKMGLVDSHMCSLCKSHIDFVEHFFFECSKINYLWRYVERILREKCGINVVLDAHVVLLGMVDKNLFNLNTPQLKYVNQLIMIGKMCVSKFRYGMPLNIVLMFDKNEMKLRISTYR